MYNAQTNAWSLLCLFVMNDITESLYQFEKCKKPQSR